MRAFCTLRRALPWQRSAVAAAAAPSRLRISAPRRAAFSATARPPPDPAAFSSPAPAANVSYKHGLPKSLHPVAAEVVVDRASGCWIYATNGRKYLDFTSGIAVTSLGHCHPAVVKAIQEQATKLIHGQLNCSVHRPVLELMDEMAQVVPAGMDYFSWANSGSEAVEVAIKLARHATGRQNVIVFQGGFHGRTIGTASLTMAKTVYRAGYQPLMSGVFAAPYAYCHRCDVKRAVTACGGSMSQCCDAPLTQLRLMLKQQTAPGETAAILFEPVLGEGGYVHPPKSFVQGLRQIATETGALLIADEVQTGYGRTGTMWGFEQYDIVPDIIVIAKGIAGGLPLSCISTRKDILGKAYPGSLGGTFAANAVSCAAAIAVLKTFKSENILHNVVERGKQFKAGLEALKRKYPHFIGDVRGTGLMLALEFADKVPAGTAGKVTRAAADHGMLLLSAGAYETLRLIPPLIVSASEIDTSLDILDKAIGVVSKQSAQ